MIKKCLYRLSGLLLGVATLAGSLTSCQDDEFPYPSGPLTANTIKATLNSNTSSGLVQNEDGTWTATRRVPLVGAGRIVDNFSTALLDIGNLPADAENLTNLDLTDTYDVSAVIEASGGSKQLVSVRDLNYTYAGGQKAGFVCQNNDSSVLTLDVLSNFFWIEVYKNGELQNRYTFENASSLIDLGLGNISGGSAEDRKTFTIEVEVKEDFNEIRLGLGEGLSVDISDAFKVYYAYVGNNPMIPAVNYGSDLSVEYFGENNVTTPTSQIEGSYNLWSTEIQSNLNHLINNDESDGLAVIPLSRITVDFGRTIPIGSEVGFYGTGYTAIDLSIGLTTTVETYNGETIDDFQEDYKYSEVVSLEAAGGGATVFSLITSMECRRVRMAVDGFTLLPGLLSGTVIHYAYVREPTTIDISSYFTLSGATVYNPIYRFAELEISAEDMADFPFKNAQVSYRVVEGAHKDAECTTNKDGEWILKNMFAAGKYVVEGTLTYTDADGNDQTIVRRATITRLVKDQTYCNTELINKDNETYEAYTPTYDDNYSGILSIGGKVSSGSVENVVNNRTDDFIEFNIVNVEVGNDVGYMGVRTKNGDPINTQGKSVRVGFVIDRSATVLNANVLNFLRIKLLNDGDEVYSSVGQDNNGVSLSLIGTSSTGQARLSINADVEFDAVELYSSGLLNLNLGNSLKIYYAFCEDASKDCGAPGEECMQLITAANYGATASIEREGLANALSIFEDFGNVLDDDIESYAIVSETLNLGQKTTLSIKFDDIAVGQEIGLIMSGVTAVANLNVIGVEQIQACYQGRIVAQAQSGSGVGLKVAGNGDKWYISITPTGDPSNKKVDELRFVWGDGVSALKNLKIHGAYLRPDYNRDGVVDCVDDALTTQILNLIPLPADICEGNTSILQVSGGEVNKVYSLYIRNYKEESRVFDQTYQVKLTSEAQFEFTGSEGDPIPNLAPGIYYLTIPNPTNPSGTPWIGNVILTIHPKETTWKGTASSNWNDWNNWDRGVPWDCTNVFIPNNVPNYPNLISAENNECWCQNIHFASNAELIGQNNLNYSGKVFIDRELKSGSYHLMSAPLQNMVTGDMFIADNVTDWEAWRSDVTGNTISGELHDNYFQTIQENGNNDGSNYKEQRIDPVVYQRFWSSVVNNATSTRATDNYDNTEDEVIESDILTTDWSRTFNAVEESYGIGQGFAVRVGEEGEISQDYDFHFPKLYNYYHYYSLGSDNPIKESNPIMRDNAGSFWPKTINKNITLRREEAGNLFLFGNPFMTHLNMKNFFIENENISTIYIYDENEKGYETITRDQVTDNAQISPMEAVFLVSNTSTNLSCVIQITDDMFEQGNASGNSYTQIPVEQLSLSVAAHGHTASCSVIPSASASDDYDVREDASLLVGSEEGSGVAVFTVAGGKALSIQRISQATRIPVGFYLREPGSVRLSFQARDAYWDGWHLTDTRTGQTYPLDAAVTLEDVSTGSGRFFLEKAQ